MVVTEGDVLRFLSYKHLTIGTVNERERTTF